MPVILTNIDEQKQWLMEDDEALLRPFFLSPLSFILYPFVRSLTPSNTFIPRRTGSIRRRRRHSRLRLGEGAFLISLIVVLLARVLNDNVLFKI